MRMGWIAFVIPALAVAAPAEKGTTFDAAGVTLYMEVIGAGSGPPLLVVNGGPGFSHLYEHATMPGTTSAYELLAKKRKVAFYDQRGTGRSGALKPGQSCTLADQIADLDAVRAKLGADKIDLLGHSWGGYLVMAYAARHPEHIRHLVIVDSASPKWGDASLFKDIFPEGYERFDRNAFGDALNDPAATEAQLHEYLSWLFYAPEKRDAFLAQMTKIDFSKPVNAALEADLGKYDLTPELPKFKFPALVITGRYDINVAPSVAYKLHKAIPSSQFAVFEKSGHLPNFEEPELFVKTIEAFLVR